MKKKILALALIAALTLTMPGCVPTPEEPIVVQKDADRLLDKAAQEPTGNALQDIAGQTPGHYTWTGGLEEGNVTVSVKADADILVPEGSAIPAYKVSSKIFTQEEADKMLEYFFEGEEIFDPFSYEAGKDYWQEKILMVQEHIATGEPLGEGPKAITDKAELEEMLAYYEECYRNAPEESKRGKPVDGKFQTGENGCPYIDVCNGAQDKSFDLYNNVPGGDYQVIMNYGRSGSQEYNLAGAQRVIEGQPLPENAAKIATTYENAKALAEGFFQAVGDTSMVLESCYVVDNGYPESGVAPTIFDAFGSRWVSDSGGAEEATQWAYVFYFHRVLDGYPIAYNLGLGGYTDYAASWGDENAYVLVDSQGLLSVQWIEPLQVEKKASDNSGLIPFEQAAEIFETIVPLEYQGAGAAWMKGKRIYNIDVSQVSLSLLRVRTSADRDGVLIPAWVFYGSISYYSEEKDQITDPYTQATEVYGKEIPVMVGAVNAVDGSYIETDGIVW